MKKKPKPLSDIQETQTVSRSRLKMAIRSIFRAFSNRVLEFFSAAAMAEGDQKMATDYLDQLSEGQIEQLRQEFKARYFNFKSILQANNSALENMGAIEKALSQNKAFSMAFVKQKVVATTVDVLRMIRNLEEIAPGTYSRLDDSFEAIHEEINQKLRPKKIAGEGPLVCSLEQLNRKKAPLVGNKLACLAEIRIIPDLNIPRGFVATSSAYGLFLGHNHLASEIDQHLQEIDYDDMTSLSKISANIQRKITEAVVPEEMVDAILSFYDELSDGPDDLLMAVRSSAAYEDLPGMSFAGQFETVLNVNREGLVNAYKQVVASKYGVEALVYRFNRGLRDDENPMCVGFVEMIDTVSSGVIYTRSPMNRLGYTIKIDSCWGLPKGVVDGSIACDTFEISRTPPFTVRMRQIVNKSFKHVRSPGGTTIVPVEEEKKQQASLTAEQLSNLGSAAIKLESRFGEPQDIEWGIDEYGTAYIFQSRSLPDQNTSSDQKQGKEHDVSRETLIVKGGTTVCPGAVFGIVYRLESKSDLMNIPKGCILLVKHPLPQWASALNHAVGLIAESGGYAGHLANVSREANLPALFGTPEVGSLLKNYDSITLDANSQEIHQGKVESLLTYQPNNHIRLAESPVYQVLAETSRSIVPLHLLDPDSVDFRPSKCQSLHDITRFIHEKSITEMFNFGKTHHFSERSSKQLFHKVPMQWWVLNLDDGFKQDIRGKYVTLEDIDSIPMHALWEGIVAFPWEGPPPVDGGGFFSVMLQATTNPALTIGGKAGFVDKNYFMISKNFCNLASKLGFHFTTIEAMISDTIGENYISFRYKGGAADFKRRLSRVQFLGEILEQHQFITDVKKDILTARFEDNDPETMKDRLRILGYLLIHTRQIDMIMMKQSMVNYYKTKFKKEISILLESHKSKIPPGDKTVLESKQEV